MATQSIMLTDRQEEFVGELVASGRYGSAGEVLGEGLRLLEERIARERVEIQTIRAGVMESLDQEARREFAEGMAEDVVRRAFSRRSSGQAT